MDLPDPGAERPDVQHPADLLIYIAGLVFKMLKAKGGPAAMEKLNRAKAKIIYDVLDASQFLRLAGRAREPLDEIDPSRSRMRHSTTSSKARRSSAA